MTTRPYELLARFAQDGSVAGVSVRTITTVNGRDFESDPEPLSGASDPAFAAFASQFAAAIVTERDALRSQVTTLEAEVARLTALVPPPVDPNAVPVFITALQGRLALKRSGLLETVETAILTANGETQIWWEYAAEWHRTNAVLVALATSLGLSDQQVDDLFRLAGSIA